MKSLRDGYMKIKPIIRLDVSRYSIDEPKAMFEVIEEGEKQLTERVF